MESTSRQRRPHGEWSLYKRADGMWIGSISITGPDRKRRKKTVSSKDRAECQLKLQDLRARYEIEAREIRTRKENVEAARTLGGHTEAQWWAKIRGQSGKCFYCGEVGYRSKPYYMGGRWVRLEHLVMDHMTPVARGGSDHIDNIVGACSACNQRKATMTAFEYLQFLRMEWSASE